MTVNKEKDIHILIKKINEETDELKYEIKNYKNKLQIKYNELSKKFNIITNENKVLKKQLKNKNQFKFTINNNEKKFINEKNNNKFNDYINSSWLYIPSLTFSLFFYMSILFH